MDDNVFNNTFRHGLVHIRSCDPGDGPGHQAWAWRDEYSAVGNFHRAGPDWQHRVLHFVLHKHEFALFRSVANSGADHLLRALKLGLILAIASEALGFRVTTIAAYLKDARE